MRILRYIRTTAGGRHAWYEAEQGGTRTNIRKPVGAVNFDVPEGLDLKKTDETLDKITEIADEKWLWWEHFKAIFRKLWN